MQQPPRVTVPRPLQQAAALSWRVLVVGAAAWLAVLALVRLRLVVLPAIIALLLSTLLAPVALWLRERGWPRLLATWAVVLGGLLVLGGTFAVLGPQVADELDDLGRSVRQGTERVLTWLAEGPLRLSREEVDRYIDRGLEGIRQNSEAITGGIVEGAVLVGEVIAGLVLTLVLVFFFVKDGDTMFEWIAVRFGRHDRHVRAVGQRAWVTLGSYVRGTALIAVVDAVLIGIALLLIGVPLVPALMVLTFFGAFFPLVGAVFAGLVAALVALVSNGPLDALLVVGAVTLIQQVEGDVLQPVVLGRAVRLHPIVVLLSLTAGGVLGGIAGAFLGVPVAAVLTSVGSYARAELSDGSERV